MDEKYPFILVEKLLKEKKWIEHLKREEPAIIYDGSITTRAGSPLGGGDGNGANGVDPADLFGE